MNKKYLVYGGLVIVLVVILVVVAVSKSKKVPVAGNSNNQQTNIPLPPVPTLAVTQTTKGQLPQNLPAKLPIESNPQVLQSQTILNSQTGQHDAQYIYVTKQTIAQNFAAYQKFLSDNKWKVTATIDNPDFKALDATLGTTSLNIILDYKSAAPQDQVSLSYIY